MGMAQNGSMGGGDIVRHSAVMGVRSDPSPTISLCLHISLTLPVLPHSPFPPGTADGIPLLESMSKIFQIFPTLRTRSAQASSRQPLLSPNNPDILIILLPELVRTQGDIQALSQGTASGRKHPSVLARTQEPRSRPSFNCFTCSICD